MLMELRVLGLSASVLHAHRLLSSSFWGLAYGILNMNHKKELLRSLWIPGPWCKPQCPRLSGDSE